MPAAGAASQTQLHSCAVVVRTSCLLVQALAGHTIVNRQGAFPDIALMPCWVTDAFVGILMPCSVPSAAKARFLGQGLM